MPQIDFDLLDICPIKPEDEQDLLKLDCTENNDSDPLEVQKYLRDNALVYHKGKASTVYRVKDERDGKIVAFFALSMTDIESKEFEETDRLDDFSHKSYPAVHLGQMGVDKSCRGQGLGQLICDYCIGLALIVGEQIACRYIVLRTDEDKSKHYKKWGFKQSDKKSSKGRFWMYRRLTPLVASITEKVAIHEEVTVVLKRENKEEGKHTRDKDKDERRITTDSS
jgi:GNAT superfamily N-acetyltransferase